MTQSIHQYFKTMKLRASFLAATLLCFSVVDLLAEPSQEQFNSIIELAAEGDIKAAQSKLEAYLEIWPDNADLQAMAKQLEGMASDDKKPAPTAAETEPERESPQRGLSVVDQLEVEAVIAMAEDVQTLTSETVRKEKAREVLERPVPQAAREAGNSAWLAFWLARATMALELNDRYEGVRSGLMIQRGALSEISNSTMRSILVALKRKNWWVDLSDLAEVQGFVEMLSQEIVDGIRGGRDVGGLTRTLELLPNSKRALDELKKEQRIVENLYQFEKAQSTIERLEVVNRMEAAYRDDARYIELARIVDAQYWISQVDPIKSGSVEQGNVRSWLLKGSRLNGLYTVQMADDYNELLANLATPEFYRLFTLASVVDANASNYTRALVENVKESLNAERTTYGGGWEFLFSDTMNAVKLSLIHSNHLNTTKLYHPLNELADWVYEEALNRDRLSIRLLTDYGFIKIIANELDLAKKIGDDLMNRVKDTKNSELKARAERIAAFALLAGNLEHLEALIDLVAKTDRKRLNLDVLETLKLVKRHTVGSMPVRYVHSAKLNEYIPRRYKVKDYRTGNYVYPELSYSYNEEFRALESGSSSYFPEHITDEAMRLHWLSETNVSDEWIWGSLQDLCLAGDFKGAVDVVFRLAPYNTLEEMYGAYAFIALHFYERYGEFPQWVLPKRVQPDKAILDAYAFESIAAYLSRIKDPLYILKLEHPYQGLSLLD